MTSMKTILLGSAAGILATGVAQAADLPVKKAAAAVQYVEICPAYGRGFYKLPGSDICIRHFGSLKLNMAFAQTKDAMRSSNQTITTSSAGDTVGWQSSVRPGWDFRSPTEFGTLRTVVQLRVDQRNGLLNSRPPNGTGSQSATAHRAYIEWAGFTLGRAGSQFVFYDQGDMISSLGGSPKTTAQQLTYTWAGPSGLKATIGLEDSDAWSAGNGTVSTASGTVVIARGPNRMYDVVASLSTEQSWGSAKISGAAHEISTIATTSSGGLLGTNCSKFNGVAGNSGSCATERTTGWAALAGVTFLLPSLGAGDQITLEASHGNGAIAYAGINGGADSTASTFERAGQWSGGLVRDSDADAYAVNNGNGTYRLEKSKATSFLAELRHYWNPLLRSNLTFSHFRITPPAVVRNSTLANGGIGKASVNEGALNLIWGKSRQTAEIGVEVLYKKVHQDLPGGSTLPAGIKKDPSVWAVATVISRNW